MRRALGVLCKWLGRLSLRLRADGCFARRHGLRNPILLAHCPRPAAATLHSAHPFAKHSRGFTLLELMLAVVMTAIIAASLASTLYIAFRARVSAQQAVDATRAVDAVGDVVSRDIANALPPNGILAGTFIGEVDSLDFYCTGPESKATVQGDCKHVQFAVVTDDTGASQPDLIRYVTTNLLSPTQLEATVERICRGVQTLTLSYFDGANWTDTWDSSQHNNTLPVAIQLTLVLLPVRPDAEPVQTVRTITLPCGLADTTQLALPGGGL